MACLLDAADLDRCWEELRLADFLEVRADRVGDLEVASLRERFDGALLYTLRTAGEGGAFDGDSAERRRRLGAAVAAGYDLIDVELEADGQDTQLLDAVPARQRVVSWHGRFGDPKTCADLERVLDRQLSVDAAHRKIVAAADTTDEALSAVEALIAGVERLAGSSSPELSPGFTCFAMGDAGSWTRPLAARLGGALTFGAVTEQAAAGQIRLDRLVRDHALNRPQARPKCLFGVVGWPVAHSLSPRLHNAAYREGGLEDSMFLPFATESFDDFWNVVTSGRFEALGLALGGFAVTTPHKEAAASRAAAQSEVVAAIGAGNTLTPHGRGWRIDSTDPDGIIGPLRARGLALAGMRVAVVGAGGAGRAALVGLRDAGAEAVLVNRTEATGERVAERLGADFVALDAFDPGGFEVIVNATALGHDAADPMPFDVERTEAAVVDMVYRGSEVTGSTDLIEAARRKQLVTVDGREVLLHQALRQYERMTGRRMNGASAARRLEAPWFAQNPSEAEETR